MDTEYVKAHLGECLPPCLAEISEIRPRDPIEYLAQWLYKHVENLEYAKSQKQYALQLQQEMQDYIAKEEQRQILLTERNEIMARRAEAEAARKAKAEEAAKNLLLTPVIEAPNQEELALGSQEDNTGGPSQSEQKLDPGEGGLQVIMDDPEESPSENPDMEPGEE